MRIDVHPAVLVLTLWALTGCGAAAGPGVFTRAMGNTVRASIVPGFAALDVQAGALEASATSFCADPDVDGLGELQARWRDTSLAWNRISFLDLGPLDEDPIFPSINFVESMRQRGTDYTGTVRADIALAVAGSATLDPAFFESLTFNQVGLLALEVLLFEDVAPQPSTAPADVVASYRTGPRKCQYLGGVARLLASRVSAVRDGWELSFAGTARPFADIMLDDALPDGADPVAALINSMVQHLEYVRRRKVDGVLDARLAGTFYPQVAAGLESMEAMLSQDGMADDFGLFDVMAARGRDAELGRVRAAFLAAVEDAGASDRAGLSTSLLALEQLLRTEVPAALGVDLGLNFSDGD